MANIRGILVLAESCSMLSCVAPRMESMFVAAKKGDIEREQTEYEDLP